MEFRLLEMDSPDGDTWGLAVCQRNILDYFITSLDLTMGIKFLGLFRNKYQYNKLLGLDTTGLDRLADDVHFNITDYQNMAQFLLNQVIPALKALNVSDLLEYYGGAEAYENLLNQTPPNHYDNLGNTDWEYETDSFDINQLIIVCEDIADLLNICIQYNEPYGFEES